MCKIRVHLVRINSEWAHSASIFVKTRKSDEICAYAHTEFLLGYSVTETHMFVGRPCIRDTLYHLWWGQDVYRISIIASHEKESSLTNLIHLVLMLLLRRVVNYGVSLSTWLWSPKKHWLFFIIFLYFCIIFNFYSHYIYKCCIRIYFCSSYICIRIILIIVFNFYLFHAFLRVNNIKQCSLISFRGEYSAFSDHESHCKNNLIQLK